MAGDERAAPVAVYGLSLTPGSRTLWAATHGRGAWKLTLP